MSANNCQFSSSEAQRAFREEIMSDIREVLREIAVPKPSRLSEKYAAYTLAIVLLREQVVGDLTPIERRIAVEREVSELLKKRAELEEHFEGETTEPIGGS